MHHFPLEPFLRKQLLFSSFCASASSHVTPRRLSSIRLLASRCAYPPLSDEDAADDVSESCRRFLLLLSRREGFSSGRIDWAVVGVADAFVSPRKFTYASYRSTAEREEVKAARVRPHTSPSPHALEAAHRPMAQRVSSAMRQSVAW